ncbi:zinc-binding alcohol dehydrogenase family protein [Dongia soli]|uniref:Zinc-type alcohol dehydrogenase-like protein n=1 Tax=Dongia soli TaxID=600628 RepID=A0ABU5EF14_9PROT|nr:zinc-binding alcohol dehydrogenase family protein [Dongia soli]MDY0884941.1 zinc-binding alcohol dehydrogenase family protein [Dongia soli]
MKAVGYYTPGPVTAEQSLVDLDLPVPKRGPRDLMVAVKAISVNPVDTKVRRSATPPVGEAKILGWDAVGVVQETGKDVSLFKAGDEVFYAGSIARPGANAELHLVDERIVGRKPKKLSNAEAAALPLTSITAWELLFDRLGIARQGTKAEAGALLIIGGAGGVGSILIQLARRMTDLTVIATASRPETRDWCLELGAHYVVDHSKPLTEEMKTIGFAQVPYIASLTATDIHLSAILEIIAPQGKFALIDDPDCLDVMPFKRKAVSIHWELMFTRSLFETPDMIEQHHLLNEVADLIDNGTLKTTLAEVVGPINAANLKTAHALIESGKAKGKLVLEGF